MWSHCWDTGLIWRRTGGRWSISGGVQGMSQTVEGGWGTDFSSYWQASCSTQVLLFGMRPTLTMGPNLFNAVSQLKCQKYLIRTPKKTPSNWASCGPDRFDRLIYDIKIQTLSLFIFPHDHPCENTVLTNVTLKASKIIRDSHDPLVLLLFYRWLWVVSSKYYSPQLRITWKESLNWRIF